jgi:hypothetical protein
MRHADHVNDPPTITAVLVNYALCILQLLGHVMGMYEVLPCPVELNYEATHVGELRVRARPWYLVAF